MKTFLQKKAPSPARIDVKDEARVSRSPEADPSMASQNALEARANQRPQVTQLAVLQDQVNPGHSTDELREVKENQTGMPDPLKEGLEQLSGRDLSDVRVHYDSSRPAQLAAHAYTQGQDIYVAPGQSRYLPHEGWHAVQQMEGRVQPTVQAGGMSINDDQALEREADVMGAKALQATSQPVSDSPQQMAARSRPSAPAIQRQGGALRALTGGSRLGLLELVFGGTGRSASESFAVPHRPNILRLNPSILAEVGPEREGARDLRLMSDGPGFVDPETGHLQGLGRAPTLLEKLKANLVGTGEGGMTSNRDSMLKFVKELESQMDENTGVDVFGYSRGGISAAMTISELVKSYTENRVRGQIFDPVAGALEQSVYNVSGSDTRVQYSLGNILPGFWATPITGATGVVLAQGGHSTATRENTGRLGDLHDLDPGVVLEQELGSELLSMSQEEAIEYLRAMHEYEFGSYMEHPTDISRYIEIIRAIRNMQ